MLFFFMEKPVSRNVDPDQMLHYVASDQSVQKPSLSLVAKGAVYIEHSIQKVEHIAFLLLPYSSQV